MAYELLLSRFVISIPSLGWFRAQVPFSNTYLGKHNGIHSNSNGLVTARDFSFHLYIYFFLVYRRPRPFCFRGALDLGGGYNALCLILSLLVDHQHVDGDRCTYMDTRKRCSGSKSNQKGHFPK